MRHGGERHTHHGEIANTTDALNAMTGTDLAAKKYDMYAMLLSDCHDMLATCDL